MHTWIFTFDNGARYAVESGEPLHVVVMAACMAKLMDSRRIIKIERTL